jgi:hypothetical protein
MPPIEPLKEWAVRKGLPESAAFPIALKIARQGIAEAPFLLPAAERERGPFTRRLVRALNRSHRKVARR